VSSTEPAPPFEGHLRSLVGCKRLKRAGAVGVQIGKNRSCSAGDRGPAVLARHSGRVVDRNAQQGQTPCGARRVRPVRSNLGEVDGDPASDRGRVIATGGRHRSGEGER
jgi:hypothetical protein